MRRSPGVPVPAQATAAWRRRRAATPMLRAQSTPHRDHGAVRDPGLFKEVHGGDRQAVHGQANPTIKVTFPQPDQGVRGHHAAESARRRHRPAARRHLPGPQPAAQLWRSRHRPVDSTAVHREQDRDDQGARLLAVAADARPGQRQAVRHGLLALDADHLLQRRPGEEGRRRSRQASRRPGTASSTLAAADQRSGRQDRTAFISTGTSPATGCGRRWSSRTAAPC